MAANSTPNQKMGVTEYMELMKWHTNCTHKQNTLFQVVTLGVIIGLVNGQDHLPNIAAFVKVGFLVAYTVVCVAIWLMAFGNYVYLNRLLDAAKKDGVNDLENVFPRYSLRLLSAANLFMFVCCLFTICGLLFFTAK